jgi:hypothetical protein
MLSGVVTGCAIFLGSLACGAILYALLADAIR